MRSKLIRLGYHYRRSGLTAVSRATLGHFLYAPLYWYNSRKLTDCPTVPRVTTVDPAEIAFSTIPRHRFPHKGEDAFLGELGGVWDRFRTDFESTTLYQSLYDRFEKGARWEDTAMYQSARWSLEKRGRSVEQLEQRCRSIDDLYENIKTSGYSRTGVPIQRIEETEQVTRTDDTVRVGEYRIPDEPRVGIGHDGTCIRLGGGRHRISIARLLDIEEIPVVVLVEHPTWNGSE